MFQGVHHKPVADKDHLTLFCSNYHFLRQILTRIQLVKAPVSQCDMAALSKKCSFYKKRLRLVCTCGATVDPLRGTNEGNYVEQ